MMHVPANEKAVSLNLHRYNKAQRHDFAKIADAAGYERFVVLGESQSTVGRGTSHSHAVLVCVKTPTRFS
jgi:hypothetical protein